MQAEAEHALANPEIKQKLAIQGLDVHYLPGPQFGKFIDSESAKWSKVIRDAGLNKQ
jgi:tripartite-type tricarboxylate transporter receptor subunit TctC